MVEKPVRTFDNKIFQKYVKGISKVDSRDESDEGEHSSVFGTSQPSESSQDNV